MHVVKSVGVLSVAKIMGLIYGCIGLIFAPIFLLVRLLGSFAGEGMMPFAGILGVAILLPVLYGVLGFIAGAIGAFLYNQFANGVGGFELELESRPPVLSAPYPVIQPPTPGI